MGRRALVLSIAGSLLVLGGVLYLVFGVVAPGSAKHAARDEIERWEARYVAARACLVGDRPAADGIVEAMAIYRIEHPAPGSCTKFVGQITRGGATDTGDPEIEGAWNTIDKAGAAFATRYALHVGGRADPADRARFAEAFEEIEAARAQLRAAAGLPALPLPLGPKLPVAQVIPVEVNQVVVRRLKEHALPSANSVVAIGSTGRTDAMLWFRPGMPVQAFRMAPGVRRSIGHPAWGMGEEDGKVVGGDIDETGDFTTTPVAVPLKREPDDEAIPIVARVVGDATAGLVHYRLDERAALASVVAGKAVPLVPLERRDLRTAAEPSGRVLAMIGAIDDGEGARVAVLAPGAPALGATIPFDYMPSAGCLTATAAYVVEPTGAEFVTFRTNDAASIDRHPMPIRKLLGCTERAALFELADGDYAACAPDCHVAKVPAVEVAVPVLAGDRVFRVGIVGQLLIVAGPAPMKPRYFAMPTGFQIAFTLGTDKVIDLVGEATEGVVITRIPL
jgi:hypothetical protein